MAGLRDFFVRRWQATHLDFVEMKDDRGVTRHAYRASGRPSDPQQRADFPRDEFEQMQRDLRAQAATSFVDMTKVRGLVVGSGVFAITAAVAVRGVVAGRAQWFNLLIPTGAIALFIWLFLTRRDRLPQLDAWTIANELKRRRRCGSCAYSLAAIAPAPDGCTVCPECGAAWRLPSAQPAESATTSPPHTTRSTGFPPNS